MHTDQLSLYITFNQQGPILVQILNVISYQEDKYSTTSTGWADNQLIATKHIGKDKGQSLTARTGIC